MAGVNGHSLVSNGDSGIHCLDASVVEQKRPGKLVVCGRVQLKISKAVISRWCPSK